MNTDAPLESRKPDSKHQITTVIQPNHDWFKLNLGELFHYRDLIFLFVRRDFVAQYKQTIVGPAWHIIQPLLTTLIFTVVFGNIAKLSTDGVPPMLFYMAGIVIWGYFANVFTEVSNTFAQNAHIFGKVYFPRLVTPIALLMSKLIAFGIQFAFFLCFVVYFAWQHDTVQPNLWILLSPILVIMMGALALGGGIIVTALTVRYRDLMVLVSFSVQLLMYATPIIYPLSSLPEPWRSIAALNPIAPIVETFRYAFLGQGTVSWSMLLFSATTISLILLIGIILFNRVERRFMDTV